MHHELCFGAYKSRHTSDNLEKIRALQFETVPFSSTDADRSGEIRALLQSRGTPIGPFYGTSDDGSAATGVGCSMNGRRGWAGGGTGAQRRRSAGPALGRYDVLIAGQAVARALTLVTHNLREFGRVPGLALEDWLE